VGHLLAWQLLSAGERAGDVPPKLAARVRLLATGDINKNDPNDARSVAVAALRSAEVREARRDDHAAVLKVWSKRYRDLGRARTQVACRLHQVLCELIPGGVSGEITAGQAGHVLESITPADAAAAARWELAAELTEDLRGIDTRIRQSRKKAATAVRAAGTSLTGLFGVGPVIAAAVIGDVRTVSRFPGRDHFAACNGTAPIEVSSGGRKVYRLSRRGNRRLNHAIHMAAVTQIRYRHSPGRAYYDKKLAEGKTPKEALRALKRQVSNAIFACLQADARRAAAAAKSREGNGGTTLHPGRPAHTPSTGASGKPLRACHPPYDPARTCGLSRSAAIPRERAAGSRTGHSPAAQRRPQGRPGRGRPRADNARSGKAGWPGDRDPWATQDLLHAPSPLTLKQRGARSARRWQAA
jgi:transposase